MAAGLIPSLGANPCIAGIEPVKSPVIRDSGCRETLGRGSVMAIYVAIAIVVSGFCPICASAADALSAGLIYDRFPLTLAPGHRTEAAGPFFYKEQKETEETLAF